MYRVLDKNVKIDVGHRVLVLRHQIGCSSNTLLDINQAEDKVKPSRIISFISQRPFTSLVHLPDTVSAPASPKQDFQQQSESKFQSHVI